MACHAGFCMGMIRSRDSTIYPHPAQASQLPRSIRGFDVQQEAKQQTEPLHGRVVVGGLVQHLGKGRGPLHLLERLLELPACAHWWGNNM